MSNGGNIQLVAVGSQDYYLTSNPQMSFMKSIFRRHTPFAIEQMNIPLDETLGANNNRFGREVRVIIPRKGNMLHKLYLYIDVQIVGAAGATRYTTTNFLNNLITNAELKIGGTIIERNFQHSRQMKNELLDRQENKFNVSAANGGKPNFDITTYIYDTEERYKCNMPLVCAAGVTKTQKLVYEFDFWFTRELGNALPLDALSNHDIELTFNTNTLENVIGDNTNITLTIPNMLMYGDYVLLGDEEKRRFAQSSHEYLIEQTQYQGTEFTSSTTASGTLLNPANYNLTFQHPVKYLMWAIVNPGTNNSNSHQGPLYFASQTTNSIDGNDGNEGTLYLQIGGQNRNPQDTPIIHFTRQLPYRFTKQMPPLDTVGIYSFAVNPFEWQPSGTCNFSRIRDKNLICNFANNDVSTIQDKKIYIFAINYNIFRINSGMGGILFS
jgi:hypothetical protein